MATLAHSSYENHKIRSDTPLVTSFLRWFAVRLALTERSSSEEAHLHCLTFWTRIFFLVLAHLYIECE